MEQKLEKRGETSLTKTDVAAYVHDMKELEIKHFTLKKFHEKLREGISFPRKTVNSNKAYCTNPSVLNNNHDNDYIKPAKSERRSTESKLQSAEFELLSAECALQFADSALKSVKSNYERKKEELDQSKQAFNKALQNRKSEPKETLEEPKEVKKPAGVGLTIVYGVLAAIFLTPLLTILAVTALPSSLLSTQENSLAVFILIFSFGSCIPLGLIRRHKKNKKHLDYVQKYKSYEQYLSSSAAYKKQEETIKYCQNRYELAQKSYTEIKEEYEAKQKAVQEAYKEKQKAEQEVSKAVQEKKNKLTQIAEFIAPQIDAIEQKKKQLYSLNIIPPDYRTLDCIVELDQMYRNNLVDTMREAVMIYEERVFRGELVQGIDKIYTMLGCLNSTMRNIENALYNVQNEVSRMCDEIDQMVCSINELASSNNALAVSNNRIASSNKKFQDDMLSESRAARYATEALKESTERCEWYMNRQYWKN